jgi:hypothetical protein
MILIKTPNRAPHWNEAETNKDFIDTWGSKTLEEAVKTAQRLVTQQGNIGDEYEILEVEVKKRTVVRAERVGVIANS